VCAGAGITTWRPRTPAGTALRGGRGWDSLIVVCAVAAYDGIRMSDWHLARHLPELAPVLCMDPPRIPTPLRAGLAAGGPAVAAGGPGPGPARPGCAAVPGPPRRGRATALIGQVRVVLSGWPQFPVSGACGERERGYRAKGDFVAGAALFVVNAAMLPPDADTTPPNRSTGPRPKSETLRPGRPALRRCGP
jgi:hypothetical protein